MLSLLILLKMIVLVTSLKYLANYRHFMLLIVIYSGYYALFYPFIFIAEYGYFVTGLSRSFLGRYAAIAFFVLCCLSMLIGLSIHYILNLTEKVIKNLFIIHKFKIELATINMKPDHDILLALANTYELREK